MSLRESYDLALKSRDAYISTGDALELERAIKQFEDAQHIVRQLSLYSDNETLEDLNTADLRFIDLEYHLSHLLQQRRHDSKTRLLLLERCVNLLKMFLQRCVDYSLVSEAVLSAIRKALSGSEGFVSSVNANDRRTAKIQRYKLEKDLERQVQLFVGTDEETVRSRTLLSIRLSAERSMQELEALSMEISMLELMRKEQIESDKSVPRSDRDPLERPGDQRVIDGADWRIDRPEQPMLDGRGKVMRPFVITSTKQDLRAGVFGPDHSLPTMSIDEYLELETARGGIISSKDTGLGPQTGTTRPQYAEKERLEEEERRKAIAWDEYTEQHTKGQGNTMNRG